MADLTYRRDTTGLLVVDPYNDFISDGGKLWPRVREVVEAKGCIPHMVQILKASSFVWHTALPWTPVNDG